MKAVLLPLLSSVLVPAIVSLVVALTVSFLAPRFNFPVWKKQKLKEQQLAIAERFARVDSSPYAKGYENYDNNHRTWLSAQQVIWEQHSLLVLIPVVFKNAKTLDLARELTEATRVGVGENIDSKTIYLMTELGARLFAEALDIPLTDRSQTT